MSFAAREQSSSSLRRWHKLVRRSSVGLVRAGGVACMSLGALVLLGWGLDIPALRSELAGSVAMQPLTAFAFFLCGLAILLHATRPASAHRRAARALAQGLGGWVTALALAAGARYLLGWDPGVDHFPMGAAAAALDPMKGRVSPASAGAFACAGVALAILPLRHLRALAQGCAAAATVIGIVALAAHFWGASELRADGAVPAPALYAAAGFVVLGITIWLGGYRLAPGQRSLRFLLDPLELSIITSFAGALVLLTAVGGLSYGAAAESARVTHRLAQVELFHGELTQLYADATDAAVAGRSFLVSGDAGDAERWTDLVARLQDSRRTMRKAPDLTPREGAAVTAFEEALAQFAAAFEQALVLYRKEGAGQARRFLADGADRQAMAGARAALNQLEELGRAEQDRRQSQLRRYRLGTLNITLVLLVLAAFLLAAVFTAIRREMSVRAQAERSLRRRSAEAVGAHRFLESVIQNIPHVIFIKDAKDLRYMRINRAGERLFGRSEREVLGRADHEFFPPAQAESFVAQDQQVLQDRAVLDVPQEEVPTVKGARLLHTRKLPLLDDNGRATHLLGISEDVTEDRHKEQQIRELNAQLHARAQEVERVNQARSTFLATMSHEIRTPMNGMIGMVELLSLSPLNDKQRQMLEVIAESGQSLLRIIDDVLDFSKVEAGKLELHEEVASVAGIIDAVRNIHSASASSKGLAIIASVDPALSPAVRVDALRLRQILNNFVSNAIKFTRQGGVQIRAEVLQTDAQRQLLRLSVSDTGVGISAQDQERLFQPFVQAGADGAGTVGGTGLGLVISRQLAALMGGSVELHSAVGQGTTLSLNLAVRLAPIGLLPKPIEQQVAELRQSTARIRQAPGVAEAEQEGSLVLVVDDHPVNRMLLQQQLAILGYAAESVADAAEGLGRWSSGRFALVLTDCQMPGMNGYELARRVRDRESSAGLRRTPIIACTALALANELEKCRQAGMDDVVVKPVELGTLQEKMRRWVPVATDAPGVEHGGVPLRASRAAPGAVDIRLLEQTWGADAGNIRSILASYARSARDDYGALRDAFARRDAHDLMQVAHRMLGSSKMVGAHALAESCELVNAAAREGQWQRMAAAMQAVEAEYARVVATLEVED